MVDQKKEKESRGREEKLLEKIKVAELPSPSVCLNTMASTKLFAESSFASLNKHRQQ
mgnify:CR=1 FL=1